MLKRLVAFLLGTVRIEARGSQIARFLNLALEQDISLWQIQRKADRMLATLTVRDFRRLRSAVRASRSRVHILSRQGFPFAALRLRRRPVLLAGIATCLGFVLWATGHVWTIQVKVTGPQHTDPRAVAAVAAEAGLKPGAWKSRVNPEAVRRHIQERMPETAWVVLRLQGTRAVIEVVEKAGEQQAQPAEPCIHLVARKAGVVEQVIPFQGEPVVRQGDTVSPGDLLVECSFKYWSGGRPQVYPGTPLPPRDFTARTLMARAIVRARIAYQEYREMSLFREVSVPTGRTAVQWVLNFKTRPILKGGARTVDFGLVEEARRAYPPPLWRNRRSPVELVIVHVQEVELRRETVPLTQLTQEARAEMEARLNWLLGPSDRVLTPLQVEVVSTGKDFAGIRLSVETLEEISVPRAGVPSSTRLETSKGDR